jgi:UDP-N-acetyl-2-amino-2-deoxyglucuronate dehydrogenase
MPLKVGIVGCGRIAHKHLEAINSLPELYELACICDINSDAMNNFTKLIGRNKVVKYEQYSEMVKNEKLDLISICTPSGLHALHSIEASRYGINVLCEKPVTTLLDDGYKVIEAFDRSSADIFVVKQNRLNPTLKKLKKTLNNGRFGSIALVTANVFWTRPQEYYESGDGWRGTWEFDGGAIMNQASHYVDLLQWLIGPVEEVHSYASTTRKIETEDTSVATFKWRNGAIGSLNVTMRTFPKNLEGSITILGDRGTVSIGGVALNEIKLWQFEDHDDEDDKIFEHNYTSESVYGHGHLEYYRLLAGQLTNNDGLLPSGREGLKSLELISAIYRSARDKKPVGLPLRM